MRFLHSGNPSLKESRPSAALALGGSDLQGSRLWAACCATGGSNAVGAVLLVHSGQSIAAAISAAHTGDTIVAGNGRGFFIYDAEYNIVRKNLVINNRIGIHLTAGSSNNTVDGNDFIGNRSAIDQLLVLTHSVD